VCSINISKLFDLILVIGRKPLQVLDIFLTYKCIHTVLGNVNKLIEERTYHLVNKKNKK